MSSHVRCRFTAVAAAAALLFLAPAAPGQFIPFEQFRSITTTVNASHCSNQFHNKSRSTLGAEPFVDRLITVDGCSEGRGVSAAAQRSSIESAAIAAEGAAYSAGRGPGFGVVHSFSNSTFDSYFHVQEPLEVSLSGLLSTRGTERLAFAGAKITFGLAHGEPSFTLDIAADRSGERLTERFDETFTLEPALYRLFVEADTLMDNAVPSDQLADAYFRVTLEVNIRN